ncbi:hypothetical protein V2J09_009586 [Rumex salicifolius]
MAENCIEANMKPLMETLRHQQDLLQQLYTELDVEREASATATNESLSMILRLQGEKAAVEMEASQYKRIAEEKMFHAQETLETFRDLIYQKEMQIASLEFQVQAYRFKLVSLGCKDVGEIESTFPVNMLSRTNTLPPRTVKRGCSLPPEFLQNDANGSGGSSLVVLPESTNLDLGHSKSSDFSSYWQQIKRLDVRVKELSISKELIDEMSNSYTSMTRRADDAVQLIDMEKSGDDSAATLQIHDIFEVPESSSNYEENGELSTVKTVSYGAMDKNNWNQKATESSDVVDNVFPKPRDGLVAEQLQFKRPDVTDFELQQMNRRLKRLEDERIMVSHEISFEEDDEKLMLLKLIKDQLNSIEDEIMSQRPKKPPPEKHGDRTLLTEAMLHFWM